MKISIFLWIIFQSSVVANWWYTSQFVNITVIDQKVFCNIFPGLVRQQRRMCLKAPGIVMNVAKGVSKGIDECQFQFKYHRWNCSTFPNDLTLFGRGLVKGGTRELAFIEAVTSAAAAFNVARECSRGFPHCSCSIDNWSQFQAHLHIQNEEFKWKGCDENLKFSTDFIRRFSDAQEANSQDIKALTTKHNNRLGRLLLRKNMGKFCKCHGLSGSCSMRTCWQSLTSLRLISTQLREKYDAAIEVVFDPSGKPVPFLPKQRAPRRTDLIFYEKSKNFCVPDVTMGILGTKRRPCKADTWEEASCDILCCDQSYRAVKSNVLVNCNCAFIWCCQVKCSICNDTVHEYFCT